jgi:hypothetical protein
MRVPFPGIDREPACRALQKWGTESFDGIKTALIGYGAAKVKETIAEILPGFGEYAK